LIVVLVLAGAGVTEFLAVPIPAGLVALALTIPMVGRRMPLRPAFHLRRAWPLLLDTLPFAVATAINATYFRIALLVMSIMASAAQTGYFAVSFRVTEVLVTVPALVVGAAFPILARAARDDQQRFEDATRRIVELGFLVGTWVALSVELGAPIIIHVLAGPDLELSVGVLRIQAGAIVATWVAVAAGYPLLSLRRHRELLIANGAALVAVLVLALVLVPVGAAYGAAAGTVAAELTLAAVTVAILLRARPGVGTGLGRFCVPVALVAAVAMAVRLVPGLPALGELLLGNAIFLGGLWATRRFPREVREALSTGRTGR